MSYLTHKLTLLLAISLLLTLTACDDSPPAPASPTAPTISGPLLLTPLANSTPSSTTTPGPVLPLPASPTNALGKLPNVTLPDTGNPPRVFLSGKAGTQRGNVGPFCWTKGCINRLGSRVPTPTLEVAVGESLTISNSFGLAASTAAINAYRFPSDPERVGEYDDAGHYYFYGRGQVVAHADLTASVNLRYAVDLPPGDYILLFPSNWPLGARSGSALYAFAVRVK